MPKKTKSSCMDAVQHLIDFHKEDCAVCYSFEESSVVIINDPDMSKLMESFFSSIKGEDPGGDVVEGIFVQHHCTAEA